MAFNSDLTIVEGTATLSLSGELDAVTAPSFHQTVEHVATLEVAKLIISLHDLTYISSAGLRSLVFARQKMGEEVEIRVVGAAASVARIIRAAGLDRSCTLIDC